VTSSFSRAGLLRRGAAGGGALLVSGSAVSALASSAAAATISDNDLSYLRVLIGAELLDIDFQTQALASGKLDSASSALFKQMLGDENAHYRGLSNLMTGAGQVPATSDDITFTYPKGSFDSQASIMKLAASLEELTLGGYLGAVQNVQAPQLRLPIGQIAANEAQHVSTLAVSAGRPAIGSAFAPSLQIDAVSAALDDYET
jgi:rubrerythrin